MYICSGGVRFSEERRDKRCCVITACSFSWQIRACRRSIFFSCIARLLQKASNSFISVCFLFSYEIFSSLCIAPWIDSTLLEYPPFFATLFDDPRLFPRLVDGVTVNWLVVCSGVSDSAFSSVTFWEYPDPSFWSSVFRSYSSSYVSCKISADLPFECFLWYLAIPKNNSPN